MTSITILHNEISTNNCTRVIVHNMPKIHSQRIAENMIIFRHVMGASRENQGSIAGANTVSMRHKY
jgi:hypothetical protein